MSTDRKLQIALTWVDFLMNFSYWGQNQPDSIGWNNSFQKCLVSFRILIKYQWYFWYDINHFKLRRKQAGAELGQAQLKGTGLLLKSDLWHQIDMQKYKWLVWPTTTYPSWARPPHHELPLPTPPCITSSNPKLPLDYRLTRSCHFPITSTAAGY